MAAREITLRKRGYPQLVRAHVRGAGITPEVQAEVGHYFDRRPDIRASEAAEHGFDPSSDVPRYLAQELAEPEHAAIRSADGLTFDAIKEWERQEDAEHAGDGEIAKDSPTATDVHVDVPLGSAKKKRRKKGEAEPELSILKADEEQRVVYGIVLEPNVEDSQGDIVSKGDVELAAHRYLYQQGLAIGDQHGKLAPPDVRPVESYVAPCDFEMGGQTVKKGSWVLAAHVADDDLWQQVKKGHKGAWSIGGTGKRRPLTEPLAKDDLDPAPAPVHVHVSFADGAIAPVVHNHMPEHGEHTVNVHVPEQAAPVVHNHVQAAEAPVVNLEHHSHVEQPKPRAVVSTKQEDGSTRHVAED